MCKNNFWFLIKLIFFQFLELLVKERFLSSSWSGNDKKFGFLAPKILADLIAISCLLFIIFLFLFFIFKRELSPSLTNNISILYPSFENLLIAPPHPKTSSSGCAAITKIFLRVHIFQLDGLIKLFTSGNLNLFLTFSTFYMLIISL